MRVAVDATALLGDRTGVGVFTAEVLARLARRDDMDVTALAVTWRGRRQLPALVPPGVAAVRRPMPARPLRRMWLHTDHPVVERWTGPVDLVHGPNFVVPPTRRAAPLVTVHDLTSIRYPELCTPDVLQYPALLRRAGERGAHVHAVSRYVADEVVAELGIEAERVTVVANGVSALPDEGSGADAATGRRLAGRDRFVLALGTVEPRKNLPLLVHAFDALTSDDPELGLVVAGPDGWGTEAYAAAAARARHGDRIVRLGWVSDDHRAALLRAATVFAYPSRYEGFGLPPLEAMAAGTPVVTTTAGALPEVAGDAAVLVAPDEGDALTAALHTALTDDTRRTELMAAGRRQAAGYTWEACAEGLVDLYRKVANGNG